ncbi:uncharacterized protein LOC122860880, partial [Aphidius gifuensis]
MFCKRLLGILLMYLIILGKNVGISEWVELPEFSDDKKIYRGSFGKYDRDKLLDEGYINARLYAFPNYTNNHFNVKDISTVENNFKIDKTTVSDILLTTIINDIYDNKNNTTTKVSSNISNDDDDDDGTVVTEENDDHEIDTEVVDTSEETINTGDKFSSYNSSNLEEIPASILKIISSIKKDNIPPVKTEKKQASFWDYLPIEFFKKIHKNLMMYQSRSVDGKYEALKTFESSLLTEIESRLAPIVNPVRKKRGSEWDEGNSQVGFPSLEGALMAISFLTFAVYLIQLVMTLFRYLAANNQPVAQPATFVVNRNKRSPIDLPDESLRILEYLDNISNHN